MSFGMMDATTAKRVGDMLEKLSKSWAAGYQGLQNGGRTGISAIAYEQLDPVLRSITMEEKHFLLSKEIPTIKSTQTVYQYNVKTAVQSNLDLAGWEAYLPQEDASQYVRVAEVLKVYGIKKSLTHLAQLVNEAGGYMLDLEKENDTNAAMAMAQALERDLYTGGDYYMDSAGNIDGAAAAQLSGPIRAIRGIQANIREGDQSQRGIPGDFIGYMNNRSVVFDRKGAVLDRKFLDEVVTAVSDSLGMVEEAHCTTSQLSEFRATFFPFERGDLGAQYAIRGAGVTNDLKVGLPIQTVKGQIEFIPTVFKYMRQFPVAIPGGSAGQAPSTPGVAVAAGGGNTNSTFLAGEVYTYRVQAASVHGISSASASSTPLTVANSGYPIDVTITASPGAEHYLVFRSPKESSAAPAGKEMFVGKIIQPRGAGTIIFRDNGRIVPGLDSMLFLPKGKDRAKLAIIGNLLNKLQLGLRGTAMETVYVSYVGCVVDRPRTFSVVDNVFQKREGL